MVKALTLSAVIQIILIMCLMKYYGGTFDKAYSLICAAGEPVFETDFPPGSDMTATLCEEPYGKERFEMELSRRLGSI